MKNKKITIVLKNCRDDIAKTIFIDTKMNMKKYCLMLIGKSFVRKDLR